MTPVSGSQASRQLTCADAMSATTCRSTIPPDQITTTLGARFLDRRLTVSVRWQAVAGKNSNDIPPGPEAPAGATQGPPWAYFPTASFNLVNLYLGYQINPDALASLSV